MATRQVSALPVKGFMDSMPRQDVPLDAMTGPSLDWLVSKGKLKRRGGIDPIIVGVLEGSNSQRARRMVAAHLPSISDQFPTPLMLFVNESANAATLAWRSTNGTDTWRQVGMEFDATTYPDTGVPQHRVINLLYENEWGGLTVHRLNTEYDRAHWLAGTRSFLQSGTKVLSLAYRGMPVVWDGRFKDSVSSDACTVIPAGLIPPLQMPTCTPGNDLGASTVGPFLGSNAFYFTCCFEDERGELSMYTIPRPPGSAWPGYEGFGFMVVDSANPTHYFDSVVFSNIPQGPPGTKYTRILVSAMVDTASAVAGDLLQPIINTLAFVARIPQGVTRYVHTNGSTLALDQDPRLTDMITRGLQWPRRARYVGRFDGHTTSGCERPNPAAIIIAPWLTGARNLANDNVGLYGTTTYYVAVTDSHLYLRSVVGGSASDTTIALAGLTLRQLVDQINTNASLTTAAYTGCTFGTGSGILARISRASAFTGGTFDVKVGDTIVSAKYPAGTKVTYMFSSGGTYYVQTSNPATAASAGGGESVTFSRAASSASSFPWAAQVVPGADADESTDSLLRTYVSATATYGVADTTLAVTSADALIITPGMFVVDSDFPAGTRVIASSGTTVTVDTASTANAHSATDIDFGYDTGDTTLGLLPGFVRCWSPSAPAILYWRKSYMDRFEDSPQDSTFTAASPGYAQDGIHTWMYANRHGGVAQFGDLMGLADMGPLEHQFYSRGRMRLWNPRTGTTHNDADYNKLATSWNRGLRSPYALCQGNRWVIFLSDEGFFVTGMDGESETLLSLDIYDAERPEGERGQLEYAINACIVASDSDSDDFKISADVIDGVLLVNYYSSAEATYFDRQIRYDFSASVGRAGPLEVLRPDGKPYPWSAPLTLRISCAAKMAQADGSVHRYAVVDSTVTGGDPDGQFIEFDTGSDDDGERIRPVAYTGIEMAKELHKIQPTAARVVSTKAGSGLAVAFTREPARAPQDAAWDQLDIDSSGTDEFGRCVPQLGPAQSAKRIALAVRISDDGSGSGAEVSALLVDVEDRASVEK